MRNRSFFRTVVLGVSLVALSAKGDWLPETAASKEIVSSSDSVTVDKNGLSVFTSEITYKVLNESGRSELVLSGIPFLPEVSKVTVLKAYSTTEGVLAPVNLKTVTTRMTEGPKAGLSQFQELVIPFNNIKIGSTVTYQYQIKSLKNVVPGHFSQEFVYGVQTPEQNSHTVIRSVLPLYVSASDPWKALQITQSQEGGQYILEIRQTKRLFKTPAEYNALVRKEHITRVQVSTLNSWEQYVQPMAKKYQKLLIGQKLPPAFKKIAEKASLGKSINEKIDIVTSELASVMTYSGDWTSFEKMFVPRPLSTIGSLKTGDCKDFSLATVAMLRELGIDAEVAVTYRKGQTQAGMTVVEPLDLKIPQQSFFNHAIVKVKDQGNVIWVDPTNIVHNSSFVFGDIAGSYALEISSKARELEKIPYPSMENNSLAMAKDYDIKDDYTAETSAKIDIQGDMVKILRETALQSSQDSAEKVLSFFARNDPKSVKARYEGIDFKSRVASKISVVEKTMGSKVVAEKDGKKYFFSPISASALIVASLFGRDRVTDMSMGTPSREKAVLRVSGYDFVDYPEGCTILTPWFVMRRTFLKTEGGFEVHDDSHFIPTEISAADINSEKFRMSVGDIFACAETQSLEVRKLDTGETLAVRMKDYTPQKANEFMDVTGPGSIAATRKALHVADNLLHGGSRDKDLLIVKLRALRWVGYKHNGIDKTEYLKDSDAILNVLYADYPNDQAVLRQKVWSALFREDRSDMLTQFQKLYQVADKNYLFYELGGKVAEKLEKLDAALGSYLKSLNVAVSPKEKSTASVAVAEILLKKGEIDKGISYYRQGAEADPNNAWIQGNLMAKLNSLRRWDDAIVIGEDIMKKSPYGIAKMSLASAYRGKAQAVYSQSLKTGPDFASPEGEKILNEVESYLMKGLRYDSNCGDCLVSMGALYRVRALMSANKEYAEKSKSYYEKAMKEGEIPHRVVALSMIELRQILVGSRKPAEANGAILIRRRHLSSSDLSR